MQAPSISGMLDPITTRCCIAGGGPAGMMLGFLLARVGPHVGFAFFRVEGAARSDPLRSQSIGAPFRFPSCATLPK
jgi:NADPH-dependent 2,4-dienoyl-CoA reductase/sulfur reductase-like enzyme